MVGSHHKSYATNISAIRLSAGSSYRRPPVAVNIDTNHCRDGILDRFTLLETLDLSYNDFASLPPGIFGKLTQLKILLLGHGALVTLPDGIFDRLGKLTTLDLDGNRLRAFPAGVFDGLSGLESLNLNHNPISLASFHSPATVFDKLADLKHLFLLENKFPNRDAVAKALPRR